MKYITFIFVSLFVFSSAALAGVVEDGKSAAQEKNIALDKLKSCYSRLIAMKETAEDNDCGDVGFDWCIKTGLMTSLATATPTEILACVNSSKIQYMNVLNTSLVGQKSAAGTISCDEIAKDSTHKKLDELALKAKLPFRSLDRIQEEIIDSFCKGQPEDIKNINNTVNSGDVSAADAESIAMVLGKKYTAPARTADGKLYERINSGLSDKGLCSACAGNIASEYVKNQNGKTAKLVDAALSGDVQSLQQLQDNKFAEPTIDPNPPIQTESSAAAPDNTTMLTCNEDASPYAPPITFVFNETKKTVIVHIDVIGGSSSEPLAATFDSNTITFDWNHPPTLNYRDLVGYSHYMINRIIGSLLIYDSYDTTWNQATTDEKEKEKSEARHYTCHIGNAPAIRKKAPASANEIDTALNKLKSCFKHSIEMGESEDEGTGADEHCTELGTDWCIKAGLMTPPPNFTPDEITVCSHEEGKIYGYLFGIYAPSGQ